MRLPDLQPARMARVAVVAPLAALRPALVRIARLGAIHFDDRPEAGERADNQQDHHADRLLREAGPEASVVQPRVCHDPPDLEALAAAERWDLLAGEAEIERRGSRAIVRGPGAVLVGWTPNRRVDELASDLAKAGTAVVRLPHPRWQTAPTLVGSGRVVAPLHPLVRTFAVVPYADVDPTLFAAVSYIFMFGMMFGDIGHGLVLAALGWWLRTANRPGLQGMRRLWLYLVAGGLSAAAFGLLYGEVFGPTELLTPIWLSPLDSPIELLTVAIGIGAVLIGISYLIGILNRWREGGARLAVYAASGIAGALMLFGAGLAGAGWWWSVTPLLIAGVAGGLLGAALAYLGFAADAGWGVGGLIQAAVEIFDQVLRLAANVLSFARLAAFGLTHAAIGWVVWEGASSLAGGLWGTFAGVIVFVVGNALAFALETLVVGVQALRLEYYELFSRIFTEQGIAYHPWQLPVVEGGEG